MTLAWEVEKLSRLNYFLNGEQQVQEDKTTQAFEEAALFTHMVVDHDSECASQDIEFITAVQKNEVKRITRLNAELELDVFLPLDLPASYFNDADTHSIGDPPRGWAGDGAGVNQSMNLSLLTSTKRFVNSVFCPQKITMMDMVLNQTVPSRQRVLRNVPIIQQAGLNIAGHSSEINSAQYHLVISLRAVCLYQDHHFSLGKPLALQDLIKSIDHSHLQVTLHLGIVCMEKSRQEYTDGVIYRDEMTGIQKTSTRWYQLPPIRPPREPLAADSESTLNAATSSTTQSSTSTLQSSALAVTVAHTGHQQGKGCSGAAIVPVIDKVYMKIVVKDVKESIIAEMVNTCGFHDSSSRLSVATTVLSDACSSIIMQDHLIKLWVGKNISVLYKTIITPMSMILNCFKKCMQDLVENLYELQLTIWTGPIVQVDHNKSTIDFLTGNNSI
ncbi:hypothetical protein BDR03DRAFT_986373 [Suillus americanus]|nr:hypothetical protein BDR03DRAFT_986373 [Suillus americanus]